MAWAPAAQSRLALGSSHFFLFMIWLEIQFIPSWREEGCERRPLGPCPSSAESPGPHLYLHPFPRQGRAGLDLPLPVPVGVEAQPFGDFGCWCCSHQVLLVGKHQQRDPRERLVLRELCQLLPREKLLPGLLLSPTELPSMGWTPPPSKCPSPSLWCSLQVRKL